jgi:phage-related protein
MTEQHQPKPVIWVGTSLRDFRGMPKAVRARIGYALYIAQCGGKHRDAKPMRGFGGAGVVEVVADHRGDTFRSVYTVRFAQAVFVLHVFQKKSKAGIATPRFEIEMIKNRLAEAEWLARGER